MQIVMLQKHDAVSWSSFFIINALNILTLYYLSDQSVKTATLISMHAKFINDNAYISMINNATDLYIFKLNHKISR